MCLFQGQVLVADMCRLPSREVGEHEFTNPAMPRVIWSVGDLDVVDAIVVSRTNDLDFQRRVLIHSVLTSI